MALTAAQKKALADANALKAKLEAQVAAAEKLQAEMAANQAAAKAEAQAAELAAKKTAREADLAAKAAARREAAGIGTTPASTTSTGGDLSNLAVKGSGVFQMLGGKLYFSGELFTGTEGGKYYSNGVEGEAPVTTPGTITGTGLASSGLAVDTFKNTLSMFFGASEMSKPWVDGLYKSVSSFYKTGSSVDESFNLALQASRNDPNMKSFTDRFAGIYALQDLKAKGGTVEVPTIAEYFHTEKVMGDVLRNTGLGSLATESFLGGVIGKGVDATEFSNRITSVFDRIDQAPKEIKDTLTRYFPQVDRASLASALLTGDTGAKALEQKIQGYEVLAAAETQGIGAQRLVDGKPVGVLGGVTEAQAANYAALGQTYATAATGFAQVAQARETEQKLAEMSGQKALGVSGLSEAVLGKKAAQLTALEKLTTQEENRYKGRSGVGTLASSLRNQSF